MSAKILTLALVGVLLAGCVGRQVQETPSVIAPAGSSGTLQKTSGIVARAQSLGQPLSQGPSVRIEEAVFCTEVKDRVPLGVSDSFDASVKKVYLFTRVLGAQKPTTVTHLWYWNEKKVAEVSLDVRSENWRTWSSKLIQSDWTGPWAVKVLDENGEVVITKDFHIQ